MRESADQANGSAITISIITPCYNGGRYLADTIRSVLDQTRPPLEMIVIDDGSTDDSATIAESFGPPVRVIRQPNRGESVARNRGIADARGTHLLFLDADDLLLPESLERLTAGVGSDPAAVAIMGHQWFREDSGTESPVKPAGRQAFYPDIIRSNFGPPHCWLVPRSVVDAAGGFCESMRWFEDWDLWWRVGLHASSLVPVDYAGARYRRHAESQLATTRPDDRALGHATLVARMIGEILRRPGILEAHGAALYWGGWAALRRASVAGVAWPRLRPLTAAIRKLAGAGPASVTSLSSARVVRIGGCRVALWTSALFGKQRDRAASVG